MCLIMQPRWQVADPANKRLKVVRDAIFSSQYRYYAILCDLINATNVFPGDVIIVIFAIYRHFRAQNTDVYFAAFTVLY